MTRVRVVSPKYSMDSFTLFTEARANPAQSALKAYLSKILKEKSIKITGSSRGGLHIRFAMHGDLSSYQSFFKPLGMSVTEGGPAISSKYDSLTLKTTKPLPRIPRGTELTWVNNAVGQGKTSDILFTNKVLAPDMLGVAGGDYNVTELRRKVGETVDAKFDDATAKSLKQLMQVSSQKTSNGKIDIKGVHNFSPKDLAKVSADFGEILAALYCMTNMKFSKVHFPSASNEALVDLYGIRLKIQYPISVKSGATGGKVTVQNLINTIRGRAKTAKTNLGDEASLQIFNIVNDNPMRPGMVELHKFMDTPAIKKLAEIIGTTSKSLDYSHIQDFVDPLTNDELAEKLEPFWKLLNMRLTDRIKQAPDKMRLIISPLGENIWKVLNDSKDIQNSLTNIAKKITLLQVNVDVKKQELTFKANKFRDVEFEFGWAGYAAGNKLGYKIKYNKS